MYRRAGQKTTAFLAVLMLSMSVAAGCGGGRQAAAVPVTEAAVSSTAAAISGGETAVFDTDTGMAEDAQTEAVRTITDMSGREMEIPSTIDKVFSTGPVAAIYLYTMDPDRMLGWNYNLNDLEKKIILPEYHSLPSFGMGDSVNYEAVIAAGPQIALDVSSGNGAARADADRLSEGLGIPVVIVSSKLEDTAQVYRFLGELFGDSERGEALAAYVADALESAADVNIFDEERRSIYFGNGQFSLETSPVGSIHAQILEAANARNVAVIETETASRIQISLEQLLAWDPDVIIVNGEPKQDFSGASAAQEILNDPDFAHLSAVRNGNVYGVPNTPFSWVDRPPGPNRIIGIRWLSSLLYPEAFDLVIEDEVRTFYEMFYHLSLTDEQMGMLLYE